MNALSEFLTGPQGYKSSNRLLCFMSMCAAIFFGFIVVSNVTITHQPCTSGENIVMWFLIGAFGGGLGLKAIERPAHSDRPKEDYQKQEQTT